MYISSINPCKFYNSQLNVTIFSFTNPVGTQSNGQFTILVSGGQPPYQYSLNNTNFQDSNLFTNKPSGVYYIYVLDKFNNLGFNTIKLAQNVVCGNFNNSSWNSINIYYWEQFANCTWNDL